MHFLEIDGRRYAQFDSLRTQPGLTHAFSTRPFDVSVRDDAQDSDCAARRRQMVADFELIPDVLHWCVQSHEARVAVVGSTQDAGGLEGFDAVAADVTGVPLMTFSADCPLVLAHDSARRVVGIAHASWRCTVAMVAKRLVETMGQRFGSRPEDLRAGIGPSAGPTRYEVQRDVYEAAEGLPDRDRLFVRRGERLYFNLWEANRSQLEQAGVPSENIEIAGICTMSRTDLFYSYRQEGPGCGHFCLLAGLR